MAEFNTVGLDAVIDDFQYRQDIIDEIGPEILEAQAEILIKAQKREAEAMKIRDTGDFINSIKATKVKKDKNGSLYLDVYPQGVDRKGTRNAEKGFIAEYGTSRIPARPWMRTANAKAADAMAKKAAEIYKQKMRKD